jgi:exonuclease SbcD
MEKTTMILAHVADIHLDERPNVARETLDEQVTRLLAIGVHARERKAKLLLCAGDVFERLSTPAERNAAIEVFRSWAEDMPVVIVRGNHDRPGDLDFLAHLTSRFPILVRTRPDVISLPGICVACLPWPRKAWLAAGLQPGEDISQVAAGAMRAILDGFAAQGPDVLLAHVEVGAALTDSGQPMAGRADIELSVGDLTAVAPYCALGHIHKRQTFADGRVCYAGSPRQTTFGEEAGKGFTIVELPQGGPPRLEHIELPGRQLSTVTAEWNGQELSVRPDTLPRFHYDDGLPENHEALRLTYHCDASDREQADAAAKNLRERLLAAGAGSVKLDPRIRNVQRARCSEIRTSTTNTERIQAWWKTRGETPCRQEHILAKLAELEGTL